MAVKMPTYSSMRVRRLWMTEADWRGFADALAEAFPLLRYYAASSWQRLHSPEKLEISLHKHMFDLPGIDKKCEVMALFDQGWQPNLQWEIDRNGNGSWVGKSASKNPEIMIRIWYMFTPALQQTWLGMPYSDTTFYCDPGNAEHDALSRRFYRLLGKFCTNRNQVTFSMPDRKVQYTQAKGSMFWFGHDAIRWANEDPKRYLHYNDEAWALRPMDPQHPPQIGAAI